MGTKIHSKSYLPLYYSMRDLNNDSSSSSWPLFHGDRAVTNGQYYNGFMPRPTMDGNPGYDKDALKQKILEHEAVFKNQVYELHRLYGIQRDMMEEVRRKEPSCGLQDQEPVEPSSSSSRPESHLRSQDAQNWHIAGFPLMNASYGRTSVTGVEIGNSPMIGKNENGAQPALYQFLNGSVSKESEALELRPLKVRKKLFDLQLPAPEYIDIEDGEKPPEIKVVNVPSHAINGSLRGRLDCRNKLPVEDHGCLDTNSRVAASASALGLRKSTELADLNEPVESEEAIAPSSVDFVGKYTVGGDSKVTRQPVKSNADHLNINGETVHLRNELIFNSIRSKESEAGLSKTVVCTSGRPSGLHPNGYSGVDLSRNGNRRCLESRDRSCDQSNYSHSLTLSARHASGSSPYYNSCLIVSGSHSVPPWANPKNSLLPKAHALENSSVSMDHALLNSSQSQEPFGGKWRACLHPGSVGEQPSVNGFYQGSASVSKDQKIHLPASGFDGFHYKNSTVVPPCSIKGGSLNMANGVCRAESNQVRDINLNEVVSKGLSNEAVIVQDPSVTDEKKQPVDHVSAIPWLSRKPSHTDEASGSRKLDVLGNSSCHHEASIKMGCESKTIVDLNQPFVLNSSVSSDCRIMRDEEVETPNVKRLLGVPISETGDLKEMPRVSTIDAVKDRGNGMIDINLECEPDDEIFEEEAKLVSIRENIDLNCCASDDEDTLTPFGNDKRTSVKVTLEIDLEASVLPVDDDDVSFQETMKEDEAVEVSLNSSENKSESLQDEALRNAAEMLFALSLFHPLIHEDNHVINEPEASLADAFLLFVDALSSGANELKFTAETDEFEAATLQLPKMKDEDCMPKPFVPDETGVSAISSASRRVQSRRGRQRRDFQRDILPGIVSLSRHEVTEDLQIFGGLMRATGHHWNSGLTRRNGARSGGVRGRRQAVVESVSAIDQTAAACASPVSKIEACLVDRSLLGWGKTTRRPRRQRCHAAAASAPGAAAVLT